VPVRERKKIFLIFLTILIVDQFTKLLILKIIPENQSIAIIKNIFHLTLIRNTGAAFGIFKDSHFFLISISIVAIILIFINLKSPLLLYKNSIDFKIKLSSILILSGAIGNLIDRLRYGYVIDFLDFRVWPVFNVADSSITIGAILLGYSLLKSKKDVSSNI
jgi:signal peptidase II